MLDKLNSIEAKYSQIEARLGASETYNDPELVARLNKEQAELQPLVDAFRSYQKTLDTKRQAEEMMSDPELRELAQEEYQAALDDLPRLERELQILLLPRDPNDGKNVIVEIRAGVGGRRRPYSPIPCSGCTPCTPSPRAGTSRWTPPARPSWAG